MVVCSSEGRSTEADRPVSCQVVVPAVLQPTGAPPLTVSSRRAGWPIGERASAENWTNLGRSLFDTDAGSHRSPRSKYFWQPEAAHVQLNKDPSNLCEAQAALKERMPEQVPAQESSASPRGPGMKFPDKWPKLPGLAASLPVLLNIRTKTDTHNSKMDPDTQFCTTILDNTLNRLGLWFGSSAPRRCQQSFSATCSLYNASKG